MLKLLITGSSGFIGTNFIRNTNEFNIVEINLLVQKVEEVDFTDTDSVLHLAAIVHQMNGAPDEVYFKINRDLAYEVALKAKKQGVRQFVLMSTAKVFGESSTNVSAWNETSICSPTDAYGKSKLEAENLISKLQDNNFKVAIIRSPLVYGAGVRANMLNLIKLVDKFPFLPLNAINNRRSVVYVGNLIALMNQIIKKQAAGIFIAGDSRPVSTTELVRIIASHLDKKIWLFKIPGFLTTLIKKTKPSVINRLFGSLVLETNLTFKSLNFTPPFSTDAGINEMVLWYKSLKK